MNIKNKFSKFICSLLAFAALTSNVFGVDCINNGYVINNNQQGLWADYNLYVPVGNAYVSAGWVSPNNTPANVTIFSFYVSNGVYKIYQNITYTNVLAAGGGMQVQKCVGISFAATSATATSTTKTSVGVVEYAH